jgi:protein-S-isoprenylcysteine O-methyltransferase Ste14
LPPPVAADIDQDTDQPRLIVGRFQWHGVGRTRRPQKGLLDQIAGIVLVLLLGGGLFGVLATMVFLWTRGRETQNSWLYVALFCVATMAIMAYVFTMLSKAKYKNVWCHSATLTGIT